MNPRRLAFACFLGLLIAAGCGALPTATLRDAQVLPEKTFTLEGAAGISGLDCYYCMTADERYREDRPVFGSGHLDASVRVGMGGGQEQAFRLGLGGTGAYAGYERAYQLAEAKYGGVVGYFGGIVGGQEYGHAVLPFVHPHAGLVLGVLDLPVRPELAVRVAGQAGLYQQEDGRLLWRGYGLTFITAEPRVRVSLLGFDAYWGLTFGTGVNKCPDCYFSNQPRGVNVFASTLGFSMDFPESMQTRPYEEGDPVRWWNFTEFLRQL